MSTSPKSTAAKIVGLVAGVGALTVLALVAHEAGHDDFARGVVVGGVATLAVVAVLWSRASRGGAAARFASGVADERERRIVRDAVADAGAAMFAATLAGAIWALFDAEAIAVVGTVLWVGLIAFVVSFLVRTRR